MQFRHAGTEIYGTMTLWKDARLETTTPLNDTHLVGDTSQINLSISVLASRRTCCSASSLEVNSSGGPCTSKDRSALRRCSEPELFLPSILHLAFDSLEA